MIKYYQSFLSPKSEFLEIVSIILLILTGIFAFSITKNSWIITITKSKKYLILLVSVVIVVISMILLLSISQRDSKLLNSLIFFLPGSDSLAFIPLLISTVIFVRVFFTLISSLPTSHLVEHQIYEIQTLEYLNRIIAKTVDFDQLINTVTELACKVSHSDSAWIEVCQDDCSKFNTYTFNIGSDVIAKIKENGKFSNFVENLFCNLNKRAKR